MDSQLLISLNNVTMRHDRKAVLKDVNLNINIGDFIAITGPNGGGKTTLLRIILRLLKPTYGSVDYFLSGNRVKRLPIGYLPQKNMIDSRFPLSVRNVIASGLLGVSGLDKGEIAQRVDSMLATVSLTEKADNTLGELSGGQMQRALFGRALVARPDVLVLDEPLSYLDKHFERRMYDIISELAPETTIILVSHEMTTIASMANRHIIVDHTVTECHSGSHMVHYDCNEPCTCLECSCGTSHELNSHKQ